MMIEIVPQTPHIGAIISGVDVNRLSENEFAQIYQAWLHHGVICVRGQQLEMPGFLAYCQRFGRVKPHLVKRTRHPEFPNITVMGVNKRRADGSLDNSVLTRGVGWHTDLPWDQEVCKATQLYAVATPSRGGDTLFASMYVAWDRLPKDLKDRVTGLQAEFVYGGRKKPHDDFLTDADRARPPAVHPVVRTHEESGRTSLYLNPFHVTKLVGLPDRESDALIEELTPYLVQDDAVYRHKWQSGDVVIWDNRCCLHSATGDYPPEEDRIHWRVTIMR
jgi:taurine dioxygenase